MSKFVSEFFLINKQTIHSYLIFPFHSFSSIIFLYNYLFRPFISPFLFKFTFLFFFFFLFLFFFSFLHHLRAYLHISFSAILVSLTYYRFHSQSIFSSVYIYIYTIISIIIIFINCYYLPSIITINYLSHCNHLIQIALC